MYEFFNAVGLAGCNQQDLLHVESFLELCPSVKVTANNSTENDNKIELTYYLGDNIGVRACGFEERLGMFIRESFFPFFESDRITIKEKNLELERRRNSDEVFLCSEVKELGFPLYSFVQNIYEVTNGVSLQLTDENKMLYRGVSLTGLSIRGMVILPKGDNEDTELEKIEAHRTKLKSELFSGKSDAYEELTLTEMQIYSKIDKRVKNNGIYGVVDNSFKPQAIDMDIYEVIGNIMDIREVKTETYGQMIYLLDLNCCGLNFIVAINSSDLVGLPKEGRRFKGEIWLQSRILI
ncbi:MAG: DUF3881 family protein [Candidatus Weimeria sp.]